MNVASNITLKNKMFDVLKGNLKEVEGIIKTINIIRS